MDSKKERKVRPKPRHFEELDGFTVEKWCEELDSLPKRMLTTEEKTNFFKSSMVETKLEMDVEIQRLINGNSFSFITLLNRQIKALNQFTITNAALLFMSELCINPAVARMYVAYLLYKVRKAEINHIIMKSLSQFFENGVLTEDALEDAWYRQKVVREESKGRTSDNILDYGEFYQSLIK